MEEIKLSDLRAEDAYELDKRLAYCAEKAFEEARKDKHNAKHVHEVTDDDVKIIMKCFEESPFAYTDGDHVNHVCGRLKHELQRVFDSDDITRQNLMLPIIGYNLIVHNEFQYEAVRKRVRNDMKGPHSTKLGDYPYNVWGRNNPYSVTREEDIPFSNKYELAEKRLEQMVALSKNEYYMNDLQISELLELLGNYDDVLGAQNLAQISLFLRNILISTLEDNKPMDTLLRLYIANCLDESVFRSMALCDSDAFYSIQKAKEEANSKNLLSYL